LALRALAVAPALAQSGSAARAAAVDRRLLCIAGGALALFVPATVAQLVNEAGGWSAAGGYLIGDPDGRMWLIRLCLTGLAVIVVLPAAAGALRRRPVRTTRVVPAALGLGAAELLVRVIPTKRPDDVAREVFTDALDWAHM